MASECNLFFRKNARTTVRFLRGLVEGALIGLPLLMVFIVAGAWAVGHTGLAPLVRFEKLASASSTISLTRRLKLDDLPKRVAGPGRSF